MKVRLSLVPNLKIFAIYWKKWISITMKKESQIAKPKGKGAFFKERKFSYKTYLWDKCIEYTRCMLNVAFANICPVTIHSSIIY